MKQTSVLNIIDDRKEVKESKIGSVPTTAYVDDLAFEGERITSDPVLKKGLLGEHNVIDVRTIYRVVYEWDDFKFPDYDIDGKVIEPPQDYINIGFGYPDESGRKVVEDYLRFKLIPGESNYRYYDGKKCKTDQNDYPGPPADGTHQIEWDSGNKYYGEITNAEITGRGKKDYDSKKGYVYEGEFVKGIPNGPGTLRCKDYTETGNYVDGKITGNGSREYTNGDREAGSYANGIPMNIEVRRNDGSRFSGENNGKKYVGITEYPSGDRFEGEHDDEYQPHGKGTWFLADGTFETGKFKGRKKALF